MSGYEAREAKPVRFQQQRTKGWRKPNPEARCVSRPGPWGNPFNWQLYGNARAVQMFREALLAGRLKFTCDDVRRELRDLGCYCDPHDPCHADVLLEVANQAA